MIKQPNKFNRSRKLRLYLDDTWDLCTYYWTHLYPICQLCESKESTQTHHIIPKARGVELRFYEGDWLAVCYHCHEYKWKVMTPQEQIDFIIKLKGQEVYDELIRMSHASKQYDRQDYIKMQEYYLNKIKEL